jgi:ABC-2 type transport system permease protein
MPIQLLTSFWFNPSLESQNGVVPGMIVLNLMMYPALLGALLIVREKESGTIFNYFASPVSRLEIILGKAIPYIGVAYLEYIILMAFALSWFQVRFVGSLFVVSTATLLYNICTIGVGLLISVVTRSQLAAMRYYIDLGYQVLLKGNGLAYIWRDILGILILGSAIFILAVRRYRRLFS